jgi:LacI family transcriptional regulator
MAQLLDLDDRVTAVIGFNEPAMIGAMEVIASRNLSIPEDISILSYGISDVAANMTVPSQTTIGVEGRDLGRMAGQYLVARLNGDRKSVLQHLSAPHFIDRGSTAPLRPGS